MKMVAFWDVASCSLVDVYRRFRGDYYFHHFPDDGGSKHLRNVGKCLPHYTTQILKDSRLLTGRRKNLRSQPIDKVH
jgi:hypothetical protein